MRSSLSILAAAALMALPALTQAQSYYDDDIYYDSSKDKTVKKTQPKAKQTKTASNASNTYSDIATYPSADSYVVNTGNTRDVDEYNRRGQFLVSDTVYADDMAGVDDFAATRRIERFHNSDIITNSGDQDLQAYYYSQPASTVNIYVNNDPWYYPGYSSWSWRFGSPYLGWSLGFYDPWYYPTWSWSWNWGWGWNWGWNWGPSWAWGPSWGCGWWPGHGPSWGPGWGPGGSVAWRPSTGAGSSRPHNPTFGTGAGARPATGIAGISSHRPGNNGYGTRPGNNGYGNASVIGSASARPGNMGVGTATTRPANNQGSVSTSAPRGRNNSGSSSNSSYTPSRSSSSSSSSSWGGSSSGSRGGYSGGGGSHSSGGGYSGGGGGGRGRR